MDQPGGNDAARDAARVARRVIYTVGFLRALSTSLSSIVLGVYLARRGLGAGATGAILTAGLAGAAVAATIATFAADRIGRRRYLVVVAALSAVGTALVAAAASPVAIAAAAFLGMVNGMGRDRGGALILEQAALPATTTDADRTQVIAIHTMLQDIGGALGAALAGVPELIHPAGTATAVGPSQVVLLVCAGLGLVGAMLYGALGHAIDAAVGPRVRAQVSPRTKSILIRISALFGLDAIAGGFLTNTLMTYFFFNRFHVDALTIGLLIAAARVMNAGSHLAAAWLARRIGLVNTMVFTHLPSSLLLVTVAFAPSFGVAAVLYLFREGLVEMDVPTRSSYVLAVVAPHERTLASGVTTLVRIAGWAVAPAIAGALMEDVSLVVPLIVAAVMKIAYDLLLWRAFRTVRPLEEESR